MYAEDIGIKNAWWGRSRYFGKGLAQAATKFSENRGPNIHTCTCSCLPNELYVFLLKINVFKVADKKGGMGVTPCCPFGPSPKPTPAGEGKFHT